MVNSTHIQALHTQFRNLRRLYFLFLILAVLALVMYFVEPALTLVLLGLSLVLNLALGRKKSREYTRNFTHLSAQLTLQRHLEDARHSHSPVLTEDTVREARMLPCNAARGGVVCHEGGSGTYRGRKVTLGDVTLAHSFTEGGKKRHNFTVGCWATIELEHDTGLDCRFIGEAITPAQSLKEMLWVESDLTQIPANPQLKQNWRILCREDTPELPGGNFLKQLDKLHRKTEGRVAVCIRENKAHILLVGEILSQKISSRVGPGPQFGQADLIPSLPYALMLSDVL